MSINSHIMQALGRERSADLLREATAGRAGAQVRQSGACRPPAILAQPRPAAAQELASAAGEKR